MLGVVEGERKTGVPRVGVRAFVRCERTCARVCVHASRMPVRASRMPVRVGTHAVYMCVTFTAFFSLPLSLDLAFLTVYLRILYLRATARYRYHHRVLP